MLLLCVFVLFVGTSFAELPQLTENREGDSYVEVDGLPAQRVYAVGPAELGDTNIDGDLSIVNGDIYVDGELFVGGGSGDSVFDTDETTVYLNAENADKTLVVDVIEADEFRLTGDEWVIDGGLVVNEDLSVLGGGVGDVKIGSNVTTTSAMVTIDAGEYGRPWEIREKGTLRAHFIAGDSGVNGMGLLGTYLALQTSEGSTLPQLQLTNGATSSGITTTAESGDQDLYIRPDGDLFLWSKQTDGVVEVNPSGLAIATPLTFSKFNVKDNDNLALSILTPIDKTGYLAFGDANDAYRGGIEYNHLTDTMTLQSNDVDFLIANGTFVAINNDNTSGYTTPLIVGANGTHGIDLVDSGDSDKYRINLGESSGNGGYITIYDESEIVKCAIRGFASSGVQAYFNAGNVGIGTDAPEAILTVVGGASLFERTGANTNDTWRAIDIKAIKTTDMADGFGCVSGYYIEDDAGVSNLIGYIGAVRGGADNTGDIVFKPATTGSAIEQMRITAAGLVGIGTTSPDFKLEIEDATNPAISVKDTTNTVQTKIQSGDTSGQIGTQSSHRLGLITGGTERVSIDTNGNLGIGDTTPDARFDVEGSAIVENDLTTRGVNWSEQLLIDNNSLTSSGFLEAGNIAELHNYINGTARFGIHNYDPGTSGGASFKLYAHGGINGALGITNANYSDANYRGRLNLTAYSKAGGIDYIAANAAATHKFIVGSTTRFAVGPTYVYCTPQSAAPSQAAEGMIYYDSDDHKLKVYNGSTWTDCN